MTNPHILGILLILLAVTLESIAQVCLKFSATEIQSMNGLSRMLRLVHGKVWLAAGLAIMALEVCVYTLALHKVDVSVAFPMSSLSFVGIALLCMFLLNEKVSGKRWLGIGLIISGTALVGVV